MPYRKREILTAVSILVAVLAIIFYVIPNFIDMEEEFELASLSPAFFSVRGPAGMDPAMVQKLEDAFARSVDTAEFKDMAKKFTLQPLQIGSAEYTKILEDGWPKQVKIFVDLGRVKEAATQPR